MTGGALDQTVIPLHPLDLSIILAYIVLTFCIGLYFSRRASRSTEEFFVSGRSLPWWIVGTSMVATTFAADTPLAVSGLVAKGGIFNNWLWWYWGIGGLCAAFLFARLWNRTGVTTDAELIELRYDGRAATGLRCYKAIWFGLFQNVLVIAWVMRAMAKIVSTLMGWDDETLLLGMHADVAVVLFLFMLTVAYTILSGLWGVVATDVVQFCIAMAGSIYLACAAWSRIGGLENLREKITAQGYDTTEVLRIIPEPTSLGTLTPFTEFLVLICVLWWADAGVDGRGYIAQRLLAAKNERHSMLAYLWYATAHICLRPWPWIVVGLCGMAFFGAQTDPERLYPMVMVEVLPAGIFGIMLASFLAAFMSTIDTQINWGASILITDVYKRFVRRRSTEREYVLASRVVILILALFGAAVSFLVWDVAEAWKKYISVTAGVGAVHIARWYWWRINAFSEIAAFATALVLTILFEALAKTYPSQELLRFPYSTALTVLVSLPVWITVTFLTRPVSNDHLLRFYRKVRPGGRGWRRVAGDIEGFHLDGPRAATFGSILLGIVLIFTVLIGTGQLILGKTLQGAMLLGVGGLAGVLLLALLAARGSTASPPASSAHHPTKPGSPVPPQRDEEHSVK